MRVVPVITSTAFAAAVTAGTFAAAAGQREPFRPLDAVGVALVAVASLAAASFFPGVPRGLPVVVLVAVSGYLVAGYPYGPVQVCLVLAMFEVARRERLRVSLAACGVAAVVSVAAVLVRLDSDPTTPLDRPWLFAVAWTGWLLLPWSLGALVRANGLARVRLRQQGAVEERMRVAAEVHDVAGHGFALVAMQAGVALLVFDDDPAQARRSLEAIRETSTTSLAALRGMLDEFQGGTDLAGLLDGVRATGLEVTVTGDAGADPLVHRLVRESLTNVVRHAGPATGATVHIVRSAGVVTVEVLDDGTGCTDLHEGRGLAGLRDRVEARGGTFEAGASRPGFRVRAIIPP